MECDLPLDDDVCPNRQAWWLRQTIPELAADAVRALGPVVRLPARPGSLPAIGPYDVAVMGTDWRKEVESLARESALIVALVGRTPNLLWELQQISSTHSGHELCLIVPPVDVDELVRRLEVLEDDGSQTPTVGAMLGVDARQLILAYELGDGSVEMVTDSFRTAWSYSAALVRVAQRIESLASRDEAGSSSCMTTCRGSTAVELEFTADSLLPPAADSRRSPLR